MTVFIVLAWLSFAAWVYRDAEQCHARGEGYAAIRLWSPSAWMAQVLLIPGLGAFWYLRARRMPLEVAASGGHW